MKGFSKFGLTCALALCALPALSETYAVCLGINEYTKTKDEKGEIVDHDLKGAVADAQSMKDMLVSKFKAKADNIHLVADKDVTADRFINEIRWLLTTAKEGDQIVFTYSGHGARLEDKTQADGYESVIVLSDLKLVPGKLFNEIAKMEAANGVNATFIFDSCFSGGMSRDPEYRTKSLGIIKKSMGFKSVKPLKGELIQYRTKQQIAQKGTYTFCFAGQRDQPTIDLNLSAGPHGLFTYLFLAMLEDNPVVPVKDMFTGLNEQLGLLNKALKEKKPGFEGFSQKPDFEASTSDRSAKPIVLG